MRREKKIDGEWYDAIIKSVSPQDFIDYQELDITHKEDDDRFIQVPLNDLRTGCDIDEYQRRMQDLLVKAFASGAEILIIYQRRGHKYN